jgi:hypothetical protein
MAFARDYSKEEQEYIIQWQHAKTPGAIAADLNKWPENLSDPRHTSGIRKFLYRRRRQAVPGDEDVPIP